MMSFDPFGRNFTDLEARDLERLKTVSEGWYVEYKEETPSAANIAKSVASFANHHGGWLFFGVRGSRDENNFAESFPGLTSTTLPSVQEKIRDAVAAHIDPTPHFDIRFLQGPCPEIGLGSDRAVAVLQVPSGRDAPFIHSSGRIYRRIADRSDPTPEKERHVLDRLYRRGEKARETFAKLYDIEPELAEGEESVPLITLHLLRDPLYEDGKVTQLSYARFTELMRHSDPAELTVQFDSFLSTPEGFLARQVAANPPQQVSLTWIHRHDGTSVVRWPLRHGYLSPSSAYSELYGYDFSEALVEALTQVGFANAPWVDVNILMAVAQATVAQQLVLLREGELPQRIAFLARIQGVFRRVPFVDTAAYVDSLTTDGVPVLQANRLSIPWHWDLNSAVELDIGDPESNPGIQIWMKLLRGLGLERVMVPGAIPELVAAQSRGIEVYSGRVSP